MSKNLTELSGRKGLNDSLFEKLAEHRKQQNIPDAEAMQRLADEFLIGEANVYGAASFYDFLKEENRGKKVYVCNGTACLTAGSQDALKGKLLQHFTADEIGEMCCLGRCHENGAFHLAGNNFSGSAIDVLDLKEGSLGVKPDSYFVGHFGTAVITSDFEGMDFYKSLLESSVQNGVEHLLEVLKTSGLRGRGGAGFPIAFKLESCRRSPGTQKFIVCNADEGDPGAYSDRYILEHRPEALLLGMMLAGFIVGATRGVLYIRAEYPESIVSMNAAIERFREAGLLGNPIAPTSFSFQFKIIQAQGAYICGEETALLNSIEGQRPEVRTRPPYPTQQGLFNCPTVVNNVETLACIPWILKNGGEAFARIGIGKSTGTKLVSLDSFFNRPGIYEVDMGTPLRVVTDELGKGFKKPVKAMHIGGPLGGLVPVGKIDELTLDFETFAAKGFLLGHASVVCIPVEFPMIQYIEHLFQFTAHESCGKCFPCRLGSTRGYEMLNKAISGEYKIDRTLFEDLIETMETGSLCALGGGLPLPVRNALQYFHDELKTYFKA